MCSVTVQHPSHVTGSRCKYSCQLHFAVQIPQQWTSCQDALEQLHSLTHALCTADAFHRPWSRSGGAEHSLRGPARRPLPASGGQRWPLRCLCDGGARDQRLARSASAHYAKVTGLARTLHTFRSRVATSCSFSRQICHQRQCVRQRKRARGCTRAHKDVLLRARC